MADYELPENGESLLSVLADLTTMVENAKNMPLSASVLLNRHEVLEMLQTARDITPTQIVRADEVLQDVAKVTDEARYEAEMIVDRAREEAEQILAEARAQAERLVGKEAVLVAAKSEAAQIEDAAKSRAQRLMHGADSYADQVLARIEDELAYYVGEIQSLQGQVSAGRDELAQRAQDYSGPELGLESEEHPLGEGAAHGGVEMRSFTSVESPDSAVSGMTGYSSETAATGEAADDYELFDFAAESPEEAR